METKETKEPKDWMDATWNVAICDCGFTLGNERCTRCRSFPEHMVEVRLTSESFFLLALSKTAVFGEDAKRVMGGRQ